MFNRSHSESWNKNISESLKGRKLSEEHKKALSESHTGLVMSEEGKMARSKPIVISEDNFKTYKEFYGIKKAATDLRLGQAALWCVLSGDKREIKGYRAIYKEDLSKIVSGEETYESIQKYRNSMKGTNSQKGVAISEEHKNNISRAVKESKKHPVRAINVKTDEVREYDRVIDMCKNLNLSSDTQVYRYLNGIKTSPYKGWIFEYVN